MLSSIMERVALVAHNVGQDYHLCAADLLIPNECRN